MTPKEKAKALVDKMYNTSDFVYHDQAKKCALIAVDEIFNAVPMYISDEANEDYLYWLQVRQEIQSQ